MVKLSIKTNLFTNKFTYHFKFFKGCLPQISLGPYFVPIVTMASESSNGTSHTTTYSFGKLRGNRGIFRPLSNI